VKTPTILQMEATECGAVALAIILAYYGRFVPLEELRVQCGVSRDGSKALNVLKAARHYGLIAEGMRGEPQNLYQAKFPCIVFWKFNHFVVVEDIQKNSVFINDPESGRRVVDSLEFNKSFTGIILALKPGLDFEQKGEAPSTFRGLRNRIRSSMPAISFLILISIMLIVPGIVIPGLSKIFIDNVLLQGIHQWLVLLLSGFFITAVFRAILSWLQAYYLLRLDLKLMLTGSARLLWRVLRLPIVFFEQRYAGDIVERLGGNERIASILANDLSSSVVSLFSIFFFAIIMFLYDWRLTVIGLITASANLFILYKMSTRLKDTSRQFLQERGKLFGIEISGIRAMETLKSSALDNHFFKRWAGNHAKIVDMQQKLNLYHLVVSTVPTLLSSLTTVIILGLGSYRVMEGALTVGTLVAFQSLLASFNAPVTTLLGIGTKIQEVQGDIARMDDVLQSQEDVGFHLSVPESIVVPKTAPSIVLKEVSFGYSPLDPPLFQNLNLTLKSGGQIAIVGATGSGKSTIAKLVCGLYSPWSGEILIDGHPLTEVSKEYLANVLGFVDQDILLFEGTVRDNLTLWDPLIPIHDLERATQDACVFEVLQKRELGFDAILEEGGQNFSGGERQRLEIARALVRNPKILVLDEGTSNLDAIIEQKIVENLKRRGYGLLMITHRLSTILDSDSIIVLAGGKIIEQGTHTELMKENGHYATLIARAL